MNRTPDFTVTYEDIVGKERTQAMIEAVEKVDSDQLVEADFLVRTAKNHAIMIKPDGTICALPPNNGSAFELKELQYLVCGGIEQVSFAPNYEVYVNNNGVPGEGIRGLPLNPKATALIWKYQEGYREHKIGFHGNVLFTKAEEEDHSALAETNSSAMARNALIGIYMTGEIVEVPINLLGISEWHLPRPINHEHVEALIESDENEWEPIEFRLWPNGWAKLHPDVIFHVTSGNHRLMSAKIKEMKTIRGRYAKADSEMEYMHTAVKWQRGKEEKALADLDKKVEQLFQQLEDILKFIKHPACEECESSNSIPWRIEGTPLSRWLCRSCYENWTAS